MDLQGSPEVVLLEEGRLAAAVHERSCALCACVNTCTGRGRVLPGSLDGTSRKELVGDCGPRNVMDRSGRDGWPGQTASGIAQRRELPKRDEPSRRAAASKKYLFLSVYSPRAKNERKP